MTTNEELQVGTNEEVSLRSDDEIRRESNEVSVASGHTGFDGYEREIRVAIVRAHYGFLTLTKDDFRSLKELDQSIKNIKKHSAKSLKDEIVDAHGFISYWDGLEKEMNFTGLRDQDAGAVKAATLATILHTLLSKPNIADWSESEIADCSGSEITDWLESEIAGWLESEITTASSNEGCRLLPRAIEWGLVETVELLLVSGADFQNHGITTLESTYDWKTFESTRMESLVILRLFLKLLPPSDYKVFSKGSGDSERWEEMPEVSARQLRADETLFMSPNTIQESTLHWIYISRNNLFLMMAIIGTLRWSDAEPLFETYKALKRGSDDEFLGYLEPAYRSRSLHVSAKEGLFIDCNPFEAKCSTIIFPYLVLTTIGKQKARRQEHADLKRGLKPYEALLSFDHLERTLDEAYYPGLSREALDVRNRDQVVSHSRDNFASFDERERGDKETDETAWVLMVPQLWLYKLGNVVVSAYSMSRGTKYSRDEERKWEANEEYDQAASADIHLGLIITSFIDRFGQSYIGGFDDFVTYPPPLDLFETRVVQLLSEVRSYIENPSGGKISSSGLEYRRERYFIHVISDVRSELAMIQHVLEQQEHILKQFLDDCLPTNEERNQPDWARIQNSQETIRHYMRRVKKIDGDADRIEKSIQDMLNLKRTHASIRDAHSSLIVSTAVIGFTVITIVFTPLAFLTALFALKVDGFESLQIAGSDGVFHSGKISGIFLSTEILTLVLTGVAVWLAFKFIDRDGVRHWESHMKNKAISWKEKAILWFRGLIAKSKNLSSKARAKIFDEESLKQDERREETVGSPSQTESEIAPSIASTG